MGLQDALLDEVRPIVPSLNTVSVESGIAPTSSPTSAPSVQVSEQVVEIQKQNKQDVEITSSEPDKVGAGTVVAYVFGILGFIMIFFFLAREKKRERSKKRKGDILNWTKRINFPILPIRVGTM